MLILIGERICTVVCLSLIILILGEKWSFGLLDMELEVNMDVEGGYVV